MLRFRDEDTGRFISYETYEEKGGRIEWIPHPSDESNEEEEEELEGEWLGQDLDDGDYESLDFGDEDIYP